MLKVTDLFAGYGQSEVLHGLSFDAARDETIAVMGRNGMGKTTLFKSLMGIVPLRSGAIRVGGLDVSNKESFRRVADGLARPGDRIVITAGAPIHVAGTTNLLQVEQI